VPVEFIALLGGAALALIGMAALIQSRRPRPLAVAEPLTVASAGDATERVLALLDLGVMRFDRDLRVLEVNPAASRLLGATDRLLVGRSLMEAFVDHQVEDAARTALVDGSASVEIGRRDSDERRLSVRLRRTGAGELVALLDDVSELRRLQRIRSEFIDNISHELRTPLTTIRLLSETLTQDLEKHEVPPRIRERIAKIDVETGHLAQMVNELLDLSRIEGGATELHFEAVDVGDMVRSSLERLRTFAERQGVVLANELPEDLPRAWGDGERLGQVLVNLLHNAVKFSPQGSTVTVAARQDDGSIAVEVRDNGVGIPRAEQARVFERFYKIDKARQRGQGGTGLGLAIARHVVEGHGGRIWVESEEGRGSVFTFTVPIAHQPAPPAQSR
jgi:two-component system, OmpR family, phosphate regulon sensor histidine kinase PhoR